jgi:hypothetical protein
MNRPDIHAIVAELNLRSHTHAIGDLQKIRTSLKGLSRTPGHDIFSTQTTTNDYAFHHGGRPELQFNVGEMSHLRGFRFGVAFSFERSRSLRSPVDNLRSKVQLLNHFMEHNAGEFEDMWMWHFEKGARTSSGEYLPGSIPEERIREGVFVFLGKRQPFGKIDYEAILCEFDRLLPLYLYVGSGGASEPVWFPAESSSSFRPGYSFKPSSAVANYIGRQVEIALRHNQLQRALYRRLISRYGKDNVRTESPTGVGTLVDVVVRQEDEYWFYEIKTARSPRACLREALGRFGLAVGAQRA